MGKGKVGRRKSVSGPLYLLTDPFHKQFCLFDAFFGGLIDKKNVHGLRQESLGKNTTDRGTGPRDPNHPNL